MSNNSKAQKRFRTFWGLPIGVVLAIFAVWGLREGYTESVYLTWVALALAVIWWSFRRGEGKKAVRLVAIGVVTGAAIGLICAIALAVTVYHDVPHTPLHWAVSPFALVIYVLTLLAILYCLREKKNDAKK